MKTSPVTCLPDNHKTVGSSLILAAPIEATALYGINWPPLTSMICPVM